LKAAADGMVTARRVPATSNRAAGASSTA
jgi:hypothetical protein